MAMDEVALALIRRRAGNQNVLELGNNAKFDFDAGQLTIDGTDVASVSDATFRIQDDADPTKKIAFQAASIATGTTRTLTVPNADLTVVGTTATQTLTNKELTAPTFTAGTSAAGTWPLVAAGTVLTTPVGGTIERDGKVWYTTFASNQRGVSPSKQYAYQSAAFVLPNNTSLNAAFAATNDVLTVLNATTYRFRCYLSLTTGATSHTTAFSLLGAGTATMTSVAYHAMSSSAAAATLAAAQNAEVEVATAQVLTAASTAVRTRMVLEGSFQVNGAGTIIPSVQFSADPTGTCQTNIGSFFECWPIGTNTVTAVGPWA